MWQIKQTRLKSSVKLGLAVLLVAAVALTGCGKKNDTNASGQSAEVVATYKDGGKVTRGEYDKFVGAIKFFNPNYVQVEMDPQFQEYMVKQLVAFRVLGAKADEQSKKDADTKTNEQMTQIQSYFEQQGDKKALDNELKNVKITQDDLKNYIRQSLLVLIDAEKKVTDEQVKTKYEENVKANAYTTATVSHVLVSLKDAAQQKDIRTKEEALKRAQEVKGKLDAGADFAAIAKEYSDDGGSKDNGGKYENAEVGQWVENFKKAAVELPIGKISDPVETEYGYHVMRVESRKTSSLEEVKASVKSEVAERTIMSFIDTELPGMIEKIENLPKA